MFLADAVIVGIAPSRLALAAILLAAGVLAAGIASAAAIGALGARADETTLGGYALQTKLGERSAKADASQCAYGATARAGSNQQPDQFIEAALIHG